MTKRKPVTRSLAQTYAKKCEVFRAASDRKMERLSDSLGRSLHREVKRTFPNLAVCVEQQGVALRGREVVDRIPQFHGHPQTTLYRVWHVECTDTRYTVFVAYQGRTRFLRSYQTQREGHGATLREAMLDLQKQCAGWRQGTEVRQLLKSWLEGK